MQPCRISLKVSKCNHNGSLTPQNIDVKIGFCVTSLQHKSPTLVYVIAKDMPGIHLETTSMDEIMARQDEMEERLEKKHEPFSDGLGQIRHNGELSGPETDLLRQRLESVLQDIPSEVIEQWQSYLREHGIPLV